MFWPRGVHRASANCEIAKGRQQIEIRLSIDSRAEVFGVEGDEIWKVREDCGDGGTWCALEPQHFE